MAKFLNTNATVAAIEDIVRNAIDQVTLMCPGLQFTEQFINRLRYADSEEIKTIFVCPKDSLKQELKGNLKKLKHKEIRFCEDLHTSCFFNEETMVITSLNICEPELFSREMGILLTISDYRDRQVFHDALQEAKLIIQHAELYIPIIGAVNDIVKGTISGIGSAFETVTSFGRH